LGGVHFATTLASLISTWFLKQKCLTENLRT